MDWYILAISNTQNVSLWDRIQSSLQLQHYSSQQISWGVGGLLLFVLFLLLSTSLNKERINWTARSLWRSLMFTLWTLPVLLACCFWTWKATPIFSSLNPSRASLLERMALWKESLAEIPRATERKVQENSSTDSNTHRSVPDWLMSSAGIEDNNLAFTLHSKRHVTEEDAKQDINDQLRSHLKDWFQLADKTNSGETKDVLNAAFLDANLIQKVHWDRRQIDFGEQIGSKPMLRLSVLAELSPQTAERIVHRSLADRKVGRYQAIGSFLFLVSVLSISTHFYLRWNQQSQGKHRFRLRLAMLGFQIAGTILAALILPGTF